MPPTKQTEVVEQGDGVVHLRIRRGTPMARVGYSVIGVLFGGVGVAMVVGALLGDGGMSGPIPAIAIGLVTGLPALGSVHFVVSYVVVRVADRELRLVRHPLPREIRIAVSEIKHVRLTTHIEGREDDGERVSHVLGLQRTEGKDIVIQRFSSKVEAGYVQYVLREAMKADMADVGDDILGLG